MITLKRQKGNEAEEMAVSFLKDKGYKILKRNYTSKTGEIDIIAQKGKALAFVEVKARASDAFGGAVMAVNKTKQQKITKTAINYIKENKPVFDSLMFDIIAVTDGKLEHIQNAFALQGYIL